MSNRTLNKTDLPGVKFHGISALESIEVFILIFTIIGNVVNIMAIVKNKKLHHSMNLLILNLSCCSILFVVTSIPVQLINKSTGEQFIFGEIGCKIMFPLSTMSINTTVLTLLLISIERYIAIVHSLRWYPQSNYTTKVILISYVYGIITVIPYVNTLKYSETERKCIESWSRDVSLAYTFALFLLQYGIPLPAMVALYSVSWFNLKCNNNKIIEKERAKSITSETESFLKESEQDLCTKLYRKFFCLSQTRSEHNFSTGKNVVSKKREVQNRKTLFMFITVIVIFAISFLPNQIYWIIISLDKKKAQSFATMYPLINTLHYSNCVLNPIVYATVNRLYWRTYQRILCCRKEISETRENPVSATSSTIAYDTIVEEMRRNGIITPMKIIIADSLESVVESENQYWDSNGRKCSNESSIRSVKFVDIDNESTLQNQKSETQMKNIKISKELIRDRQRRSTYNPLPYTEEVNPKDLKIMRKYSLPIQTLNREYDVHTLPPQKTSSIIRFSEKTKQKNSKDKFSLHLHRVEEEQTYIGENNVITTTEEMQNDTVINEICDNDGRKTDSHLDLDNIIVFPTFQQFDEMNDSYI